MASGMKLHDPAFYGQGNGTPPIGQITPDEIDRYEVYTILNPLAAANIGTVAPGTVDAAITMGTTLLDYPRNVALLSPGASGFGGTATITGKDQFGVDASETITVATAAAGGTTGGTKIFAEVTAGNFYTAGGDVQGTVSLGVTLGTALNASFGLPCKIASTADVKRITWLDDDVSKPNQDPGTAINVASNAFVITGDGAAADSYVLWIKSTYDAGSDTTPRISNL